MPATVFDEDPLFDPDELKMPESPAHRQAIDAIGLAATRLLGSRYQVFRDMNWYPPDGGTAMAPDVMVLAAGVMPPTSAAVKGRAKSYRQDQLSGPPPSVVVEVPSDTDGYAALRSKARRCVSLGAVVYIVLIDDPLEVTRVAAGERDQTWTDRPIPELGGLQLTFDDDILTVVLPDGSRAAADHDLITPIENRADAAEDRADAAERRLEALADQLRALGVEPDLG